MESTEAPEEKEPKDTSPENTAALQSPEAEAVFGSKQSTDEAEENATLEAEENATLEAEEKVTHEAEEKASLAAEEKATIEADETTASAQEENQSTTKVRAQLLMEVVLIFPD